MRKLKAIYITGFMGAGKTTVGKEVSKNLDIPVYDSDDVVVAMEQRTIEEIFKSEGENYFRQAESRALRSLPTKNVVITTGGGIILKESNRQYMKENGIVLYLHCSAEVIFDRLKDDKTRPLLSGDKKKEIISRLAERLPLYEQADYTLDTSTMSIDEAVTEVIQILIKNNLIEQANNG